MSNAAPIVFVVDDDISLDEMRGDAQWHCSLLIFYGLRCGLVRLSSGHHGASGHADRDQDETQFER